MMTTNALTRALIDAVHAYADVGPSHVPYKLRHPEAPRVPSGRRYEATGNARLDTLLRNLGPEIRYGGPPATASGEVDYISMPHAREFETMEDFRAILLHELSHWTAHHGVERAPTGYSALDAFFGNIPKGYAQEEMAAETSAALVLDALGEDPELAKRARYVGNWSRSIGKHEREEELRAATAMGGRIAEFLVAHSMPRGGE